MACSVVPPHAAVAVANKIDDVNRRARRDIVAVTFDPNPLYDPMLYRRQQQDSDIDPTLPEPNPELLCPEIASVWAIGTERLEGRRMRGAWDFTNDGPPVPFGEDLDHSIVPDPKLCDHCGTRRARKMVFVFDNADGSPYFVGSTCLKDVAGTTVANMLLLSRYWAELLGILGGDCDDDVSGKFGAGGARNTPFIATLLYIACADWNISIDGFVKSGGIGGPGTGEPYRQATKEAAMSSYVWVTQNPTVGEWLPERLVRAQQIIDWALTLPDEGFNGSMKAVAAASAISARSAGVAAYMPAAFDKARVRAEQAAEREDENARWTDVPTGRQQVTGRVLSTKWKDTQFGSTLKMMVRCDGFDVWGSVPRELHGDIEAGDTVTFTARFEQSNDKGFGFFTRPSKAVNADADKRAAERICPHCGERARKNEWDTFAACSYDCRKDLQISDSHESGHRLDRSADVEIADLPNETVGFGFASRCECGARAVSTGHFWKCETIGEIIDHRESRLKTASGV